MDTIKSLIDEHINKQYKDFEKYNNDFKNLKFKFKEIIDLDKFNNFSTEEKQQFYIDNEIWIYIEDWDKKEYRNRKPKNIEFLYDINKEIFNEIIIDFKAECLITDVFYYDIIQIDTKLSITHDLNKKNKIIDKEYKKYKNKMLKIDLSLWYLNKDLRKYDGHNTFIDRVHFYIFENNIIDKYITKPCVKYMDMPFFQDWIAIVNYEKVLNYLSNYQHKINISKKEKPTEEPIELPYHNQKIMMMYELGIINFLIEQYELKPDNTIEFTKLGNIISSFTGIKLDSIRKTISAIYNKGEYGNNPYESKKGQPKKNNINKINAKFIQLDINKKKEY